MIEVGKKVKEYSIEEFKKIIQGIESSGLEYYVFGGFCYDGLNGEKRTHSDLDLVLNSEEQKALEIFRDLGYTTYRLGRKHDYRKELETIHKIDVLFLQDKEDKYILRGNLLEDHIPKKVFSPQRFVHINSTCFRIMPFEWLKEYYKQHPSPDSEYYSKEKVSSQNRAIGKITPLCRNITGLTQTNIPKPEDMIRRLIE